MYHTSTFNSKQQNLARPGVSGKEQKCIGCFKRRLFAQVSKKFLPIIVLLIFGLLVLPATGFAQSYNMQNGTINTCSGTFYDTGGASGDYTNNQNLTLTICPDNSGDFTEVAFTFFYLEANYDFLSIYNGSSTSDPLIGTYTGFSSPGTVTSTHASGCLTFRFTSDFSITDPGWIADIYCRKVIDGDVLMQNGTINTCSGTFYDTGGAADGYTNNQNLTLTICPDNPGDFTEVAFTFFDLETNFDFLSIYNGSSTGDPLIDTYTGSGSPGTVTSTDASGCLTFQFSSDGTLTRSGWAATISCVAVDGTPPTVNCPPDFTLNNCPGVVPDLTNMILANSSEDFSGIQGNKGWEYGRYSAFSSGSFTQLPNFTGFVWNNPGVGAILDFPQLDANGGHPQFEGLTWSVRRWTSNYTGAIVINAEFYDRNLNCGDGAHVRIFQNGTEVFQYLDIPGTLVNSGPITLAVNTGDQIDFAIDPKFDAACDDTHFRATIGLPGLASVTDDIGVTNIVQNPTPGTVVSQTNTTITLTAFDAAGNSNSCSTVMTLTGCNQPPEALCQNLTVNANANCQGVATAAAFDGGSSDPDGDNLSFSVNPTGPYPLGTTNVTLTVSDPSGESDVCNAIITVEDNTPPSLTCVENFTAELNQDGEYSLFLGTITSLILDQSDNCGLVTGQAGIGIQPVKFLFDCSDIGQSTVTIINNDINGNQNTCEVNFIVADPGGFCNEPPVAVCKNLDLSADGNCEAGAVAEDFDAGSYDPDGDPLTFSVSPAGPYPVGTTNVILTVEDGNGASDTCPATVTVTDFTPPVIGVNNSSFVNPGSVAIPGSFNSELGCGGDWEPWCPNIELGYDADDQVWQGTFNIPAGNWEYKAAMDDSWDENYGLGGVYYGPNIPLNLGTATNVKFYYDPQTNWITDNVNSRIVTAAGNFQSEIGCPGDWEPWCLRSWLQDPDGDGIYTKTISGIPAGNYETKAAINEGWAESYPASNLPFTVPDDNSLVTFSFNSYTNYYEVIITPNEVCPEPMEITTDDGLCTGSTPDFLALTNAYDNCGIMSLTQSPAAGDPVGVGTTTVTITAMDAAGLKATCTTSVTVYDYTPPTVLCQSATIQLNQDGQAIVTVGDVAAEISDACGIAESGIWNPNFSCENIGTNTVYLYAFDNNGNYNQCEATVTIEDNIDPVIDCPGPIVTDNDQGQCGANVAFEVTASDNCGETTVVCTIGGDDDGGGEPQSECATNNINLSITFDNYPQETSWMIMDKATEMVVASGGTYGSEPDGSTIDIPLNLPEGLYVFVIMDSAGDGICCGFFGDGSYTLSSEGDIIATGGEFFDKEQVMFCVETPVDDGGDMPLTEVQSGDFFPVGTTTVTCSVTDGSGNIDVCTFDITVNDTEAPMIDTPCPESITRCGAQNVSWTPPTATDNCGVVQTDNNYNPGDFFEVGVYTVTYTFYDEAGLSVSCSFVITINPVPEVEISQEDLPLWCQGIQVLTANVLNPDALTYPLTFEWSDGLGGDPVVVAPANGTYSVIVTDALGCSTEVSTLVDENISELFSAYTIISGEELEMYESDVIGGGVGIEDADEAEISDNSNIFTFLRADADNVLVDGTSFINEFIDDDFEIDFPPFMSNPFVDNNNITVPANTTMTLTGSNYGYVKVGSGATLIIDVSQVYLQNLATSKDATILLTQPTDIMIRRKLNIGESNVINPDGYTAVIYVSDNASIGQGSEVTINIYAPEGLEVNDSGASLTTYMTGIFVGNDGVNSDHLVVWNWNLNCSFLEEEEVPVFNLAQPTSDGPAELTTEKAEAQLNVYPNPTSGVVNVEVEGFMGEKVEYIVYDSFGKEVMRQVIDQLELPVITIDMAPAQFANGMYQMSLKGEKEMKTVRFVLSK